MEERTLKIDLATAQEWYHGYNDTLKKLALLVFSEEEILGKRKYQEKLRQDEIERINYERRMEEYRREDEAEKRELRKLREWGDEWGDV